MMAEGVDCEWCGDEEGVDCEWCGDGEEGRVWTMSGVYNV